MGNINRKLLGLTSMNPFSDKNSSSRSVMFLSQISQSLNLINAEPSLILSGLEEELAKANFHDITDSNIRILNIIPFYPPNAPEFPTMEDAMFVDIVYMDLDNELIDFVRIERWGKYDKKFGFEKRWTDTTYNLEEGVELPPETKFTKTMSEVRDGVHGYGINAAVLATTAVTVSEDAIVISETLANKMKFYTFETITMKFGGEKIPLNIYGDMNNYKIIPDVGETISDKGIVMAIREFETEMFPVLCSDKELMEYNPTFDTVYAASKSNGVVVDVKVIHTPKNKDHSLFTKTHDQIDKYVELYSRHHDELIEVSDRARMNYRMGIGDALHVEIVHMLKLKSDRITNKYKQEPMDTYHIEVTIRYENTPGIGYKITNMHGAKGIVSEVRKESEMPIDSNGIVAEMIINPNSVVHRMNLGTKYEGYIRTATLLFNKRIKEHIKSLKGKSARDKILNNDISDLYANIVKFYDIINPEGHAIYHTLSDSDIREFLLSVYKDNLYVYMPVDMKKSHVDIVKDLMESEFAVGYDPFKIPVKDGYIDSVNRGMVECMYLFLLNKTADDWLSVASAKLNHFGLPVSPSRQQKMELPFNNTPAKILSETETRLVASTVSATALAEMRDRTLSLDTHMSIYGNIMTAKQPTNIDKIVDRNERPFGGDTALNILESIINPMGIDFTIGDSNE